MKDTLFKFLKSLKWKIFFLIFLAAMIPTVGFCIGYYQLFSIKSIQADKRDMYAEGKLLASEISSSGYILQQDDESIAVTLTSVASAYNGRIIVCDSSLNVIKDTYGIAEGKIFVWEYVTQAADGTSTYYFDKDNELLSVCVPIKDSDDSVIGVVIISKSTTAIADNLAYIKSLSWIFGIVIGIFAVVFGLVFGSRYTSPFDSLRDNFKNASSDDASDRMVVSDYQEAEELSAAMYDYIDKMQAIDKSRQEFVSNVSHELKTPLTSMKVLADSINAMGEGAPVELYQEFMQDIGNEIDRETSIINDLLSMVRMDKSNVTLNVEEVNINELLDNLMKRLRPIAEKKHVELVFESYRPITAEVDPVKLSLAFSNLIENGIKYNVDGGFVHVTLNSDHQYFYLQVEDSGMGIPEDSLNHVFERFYRVDKSHSREIGGTGLGLAITKMSIDMHNGEIKVASTLDEGTTFDVRIPLSYIKKEVDHE